MLSKKTRWEGWRCPDGGLAFFPSSHSRAQKDAIVGSGDKKRIFTCWASSHEDAMAKWHKFNGWEPYKPMEE